MATRSSEPAGEHELPPAHKYVIGREHVGFDAVPHAMPRPASTADFTTRASSVCEKMVLPLMVMGAGVVPFVLGESGQCQACADRIIREVEDRS